MDTRTSPLAALNDPSLLKTDGLIDGTWVAGNARFAVTDPATGQELAQVANLGPADAEAAIAAANRAWPAWRAMGPRACRAGPSTSRAVPAAAPRARVTGRRAVRRPAPAAARVGPAGCAATCGPSATSTVGATAAGCAARRAAGRSSARRVYGASSSQATSASCDAPVSCPRALALVTIRPCRPSR